jgi:hypothetical protein
VHIALAAAILAGGYCFSSEALTVIPKPPWIPLLITIEIQCPVDEGILNWMRTHEDGSPGEFAVVACFPPLCQFSCANIVKGRNHGRAPRNPGRLSKSSISAPSSTRLGREYSLGYR